MGDSIERSIEEELASIIERLHALYPKLIDLSLSRVEALLDKLGSPHLQLKSVIHVAGTNGKGSTIATLRAVLEASGHSCNVLTSPHLCRINERIRLSGEDIQSATLIDLLKECMHVNASAPITFFEMMAAASFLACARYPADYTLVETGLGGRFDATNVIPDPAATIITSISYDHQEFLGNTLPKIAFEKAGIMKSGSPCIISHQTAHALKEGVMDVFQSHALSTGSSLYQYGSEWVTEPKRDEIRFSFQGENYIFPQPNLVGSHQIYNTGAALAALKVIPAFSFDPEKISTGLGQIEWPGRLQKLQNHPLKKLLNQEDDELWIDGGHNQEAGHILADQAKKWAEEDSKPLHLIVGMVNRKDPKAFLEPLAQYASSVIFIPIPGDYSCFSPDEMEAHVKDLEFQKLYKAENAEDALKTLSNSAGAKRVLIAGSLYLVGHVLGMA